MMRVLIASLMTSDDDAQMQLLDYAQEVIERGRDDLGLVSTEECAELERQAQAHSDIMEREMMMARTADEKEFDEELER